MAFRSTQTLRMLVQNNPLGIVRSDGSKGWLKNSAYLILLKSYLDEILGAKSWSVIKPDKIGGGIGAHYFPSGNFFLLFVFCFLLSVFVVCDVYCLLTYLSRIMRCIDVFCCLILYESTLSTYVLCSILLRYFCIRC